MSAIGIVLPFNTLTPQFIFSLCCAEKVSCKLGASHVVKNLLILSQTFAEMNITPVQASIQSLITRILKNSIILIGYNSSVLCSARKSRIMLLHLPAKHKSFFLLFCEGSN